MQLLDQIKYLIIFKWGKNKNLFIKLEFISNIHVIIVYLII